MAALTLLQVVRAPVVDGGREPRGRARTSSRSSRTRPTGCPSTARTGRRQGCPRSGRARRRRRRRGSRLPSSPWPGRTTSSSRSSLTFAPGCVACAPSANAFACRITSGIGNGDDVADLARSCVAAPAAMPGEVDRVLGRAEVLGRCSWRVGPGRLLEVARSGTSPRAALSKKPNDVAEDDLVAVAHEARDRLIELRPVRRCSPCTSS